MCGIDNLKRHQSTCKKDIKSDPQVVTVRLKEFFMDEEEEEESDAKILFHFPSTWMPLKGRDAALETYCISKQSERT